MKATIEGTPEQVREGAALLAEALVQVTPRDEIPRAKRGEGYVALQNKKIAAEYKLLVQAFKAIRNKPERSAEAGRLLAGISDLSSRTKALLSEAQVIVDTETASKGTFHE